MPVYYLDSSALVKRYVAEGGSCWVRALCLSELIVISLLTTAELASALARRTREGRMTSLQRDLLFERFLTDIPDYEVLELDQPVIRGAARLLLTHPPSVRLRTLDALHLSGAQLLQRRERRH